MRVALAVAAVVLLAGCSGKPDPTAEGPAVTVSSPSNALAGNEAAVPLSFDGADQEQGVVEEGTIPMTDTCLFLAALPCTSQRSIDITPIVPPDVPVQVALTLDHDAGPGTFVSVNLRLDQATATRYDFDDQDEEDLGAYVAVVLMAPGGTVEAVVTQRFPTLAPPSDLHFTLEARTVVRTGVVPSLLPVAVDLEAGQALTAAGDGLEDLVVIPPGGTAQHHLGPFTYGATAAGRHIAIASGAGDIRFIGPNGTTLRALLVQEHMGDPHPASSGQDVAWEFTVDGVPLRIGLLIESVEGRATVHGAYEMTVVRAGVEVLVAANPDCAPLVVCQGTVVGHTSEEASTDYLDEHIGPGSYQVTARFETANDIQVRETYSYVVP